MLFFMHTGVWMKYAIRLADTRHTGREEDFAARFSKDLSRLGRNYLQTGTLIEDFFPQSGVRYIAMNDSIDTMKDNNDIAPFKNILNEMYSKDISKKVHYFQIFLLLGLCTKK